MERDDQRPHMVAFPFPAQGHINPMLQFSKLLASKGLKITLVTFIDIDLTKAIKDTSVTVESIYNEEDDENEKISATKGYWQSKKSMFERKLTQVVNDQVKFGCRVSCLLYDSIMPWALDIARKFGLLGACFFTQTCAVSAIYCHVHQGNLRIPIKQSNGMCYDFPGMPPLQSCDLSSTICDAEDDENSILRLMTGQFSNIKEADWIFFNSFNSLQQEVMKWLLASQFSVKLIGPLIPSTYLDKRLKDDNDYGLSLFKPESNCIEWLNSKETRSVIYVSFGSMATFTQNQMEEIASALQNSNYNFLWVVRKSEENNLPKDFFEETSEKGLVVTWCPQLQILAHKSVGCFVTHCGWNSTIEALSLEVPMIAMPHRSDQMTNAKFVADVWEVGVRVKRNEEGIVTKEEILQCIMEVMVEENANNISENYEKWKRLAQEAVAEGGSSEKNIEEFVAKLKCALPNSENIY